MQVTFPRALLVLLACTSATQAMPNLIEVRADNAVNQVNAPTEAQMAEAQAHADQFLSTHQAETAAFADSLNKAQAAAKADGKELDISGIFKGLDFSGIKLPELNITSDADAEAPPEKEDAEADDKKAKTFPPWPYPGTYPGYYPGAAGGYNSYYCYYCYLGYTQYCPYCTGGSGGGYSYLCATAPQYCAEYPDYIPNPYGIKPFDGPTSCGDLGEEDADQYGFICSEAADSISYCTVNPKGSYDYLKCGKKGSCGCLEDGSFCFCARG